jgi:hypothetical protein
MESESFIWKKAHQNNYYQILVNQYLKKIFKSIKNKGYVFYLDHDNNDFDRAVKYYNGEPVNIADFEKPKEFRNYKTFPMFIDRNDIQYDIHDVDHVNVGFTITNLDEEDDLEGNKSGCYQCKARYGEGFWFEGLAYNTGLDEENPDGPIEYEGYIKTYDFFSCNCDNHRNPDEMICSKQKYDYHGQEYYDHDLPFVVITCTPKNNKHNVTLIRNCILFNVKYAKFDQTNINIDSC